MTSKPQRTVIRAKQLEDHLNPALAALNDELGQRVVQLMTRFYLLHVQPLEHRLAWLELPWWQRVGRTMPALPDVVEERKPEPEPAPRIVNETVYVSAAP